MATTPDRQQIMGSNQGNPNWREDLMAKVHSNRDALLKKRGITKGEDALTASRSQLTFVCKREWLDLLHEAAVSRGLSTSSYARRVLSVAVAQDLGLALERLLLLTPKPTPSQWMKGTGLRRSGTVDDGEGIEEFCFHPGCDGSHLSPQ